MLTRCVSDCYSKPLKNTIEPLHSLSSGCLPVNVSTRAMSRKSDARPLGQDNPPAVCPVPAPTPGIGASPPPADGLDDLRYALPDGSFRVRQKPFICYNCRTPHPGGEWRCTHPCRSCGSRDKNPLRFVSCGSLLQFEIVNFWNFYFRAIDQCYF